MTNKLSNNPPRGTYDWLPDEFAIRNHIFSNWRKVAEGFGYEEYLTPVLENADLYRAKSGEDTGGTELMVIDKGDEELAIRPEMTPSITRLITKIYNEKAKPIKYFSIANFYRYQKPQKGRNREFWQINCDIFGSTTRDADLEILIISLENILAFSPPEGSFTLYLNNRHLIDEILSNIAKVSENQRINVMRILDKWEKLSFKDIKTRLQLIGLSFEQIEKLSFMMKSQDEKQLATKLPEVLESDNYKTITYLLDKLESLGYKKYVEFKPGIIRGLDYYDGIVFEIFNNNPNNNRAIAGGGRYNGLADIFGKTSFPAVGYAAGDEPLWLFLKDWNLLDDIQNKIASKNKRVFIPIIVEDKKEIYLKLAQKIRTESNNNQNNIGRDDIQNTQNQCTQVVTSLEQMGISKSLQYANKNKFDEIILIGEDEISKHKYISKNLATGKEKEHSM